MGRRTKHEKRFRGPSLKRGPDAYERTSPTLADPPLSKHEQQKNLLQVRMADAEAALDRRDEATFLIKLRAIYAIAKRLRWVD